jgi:Trypsin
MTRRWLATAATVVVILAAWSSAAPDVASAGTPDEIDVAAVGLARDRGISIDEADQRLDWQAAAPDLAERLSADLDAKFGGLWIAIDDGDRLKVGVVSPVDARSAEIVRADAVAAGVGGVVDTVAVRHSQTELDAASDWLGEELTRVNVGAGSSLRSGIRTNLNAVALDQIGGATLTPAQTDLIATARARYGDLLTMGTYPSGLRQTAGCFVNFCPPPLRGGVKIRSDVNIKCTGGFIAQQTDGTFVQLTAGHCWRPNNGDWKTVIPIDFAWHTIGPTAAILSSLDFDVLTIKLNNPLGWAMPSATVHVTASDDTTENETYAIHSDNLSTVGMRICTTGEASIFSDCGTVDELNVTDTFEGITHHHFGIAEDICASSGDSGSPMYAKHIAFGIAFAGDDSCNVAYEGVRKAEILFFINILHS